jgi:hypothetical protein
MNQGLEVAQAGKKQHWAVAAQRIAFILSAFLNLAPADFSSAARDSRSTLAPVMPCEAGTRGAPAL